MFSDFAKDALQWMLNHFGLVFVVVLFLLSLFFKIAKKEVDPLGAFIGWIGKALTKDLRTDVNSMKADTDAQISNLKTDLDNFEKKTNKSITSLQTGTANNCKELKKRLDQMEAATQKSNDMQTVMQIKAHVLDFANSCMNHRRHTKMDFQNIIDENTLYEELVKKYNLKNDVYKEDYAFIMQFYHDCQKNNSFLNENVAVS